MTKFTQITTYDQDFTPRVILEFEEAMDAHELLYLSCDLLDQLELEDGHMLDPAIERAINACISLSIPSRRHFRKVFIIRQNDIQRGWKLSALGCYLTILNEDPSHPMIAQFQTFLF